MKLRLPAMQSPGHPAVGRGDRAPDAERSLRDYRRLAPDYDARCRRVEPLRAEAVDLLGLRPGDRVLDVGCGTGLGFPLILGYIGPAGQLTGIEHSPEMAERARSRVAQAGWRNVSIHRAPAQSASLARDFDAVLFCFTHDVLRSARALDATLARLRPGARVVAMGAKVAPLWAGPLRLFTKFRCRHYVTTFEGFDAPWSLLAQRLPGLEVRPRMLGTAYLAWGQYMGRKT